MIMICRSCAVSGPTRERGGLIKVRSTGDGAPSACNSDTNASLTFSSVMALETSTLGFGRKDAAADFTAASSRGVKARRAWCTRLARWNVDRVLRDEVYADAFGADEANDLLDFFEERGRCIVEQQMRLVEEECEFRLVLVADLRKQFEQFAEKPQ